MDEENKMIKPFEIERKVHGRALTEEEAKEMVKRITGTEVIDHPVEKPFTTKFDPDTPTKLYLILWERACDDKESERYWEFFNSTTQALYNYLRDEILASDKEPNKIDVMKSRLIVDSNKIKLSQHISVYLFMKDVLVKGKVTNDTDFDIENYYYEEEE